MLQMQCFPECFDPYQAVLLRVGYSCIATLAPALPPPLLPRPRSPCPYPAAPNRSYSPSTSKGAPPTCSGHPCPAIPTHRTSPNASGCHPTSSLSTATLTHLPNASQRRTTQTAVTLIHCACPHSLRLAAPTHPANPPERRSACAAVLAPTPEVAMASCLGQSVTYSRKDSHWMCALGSARHKRGGIGETGTERHLQQEGQPLVVRIRQC